MRYLDGSIRFRYERMEGLAAERKGDVFAEAFADWIRDVYRYAAGAEPKSALPEVCVSLGIGLTEREASALDALERALRRPDAYADYAASFPFEVLEPVMRRAWERFLSAQSK